MKTSKKDLENYLLNLKKEFSEFETIILKDADSRCGRRVALARKSEQGGFIHVFTDFIPYSEMDQLLTGYCMAKRNELINN